MVGHGRAFTIGLIGAALGLAVLSTVAASHTHSEIASGTSAAMALTDGFQLQFELGALFCLAGALIAAVLLRPRRASPVGEGALEAERA